MAYHTVKEFNLPTDIYDTVISFLGNVHTENRARFWKKVCLNDIIDSIELYENDPDDEYGIGWDGTFNPNDVDVIRCQSTNQVRFHIAEKYRSCLEEIDPNYSTYFNRETTCINVHSYLWKLCESLKNTRLNQIEHNEVWMR